MKITQSNSTSITPLYYSPITQFTTITHSFKFKLKLKFISISLNPQFPYNSCKRHCLCNSKDEISPNNDDVEMDRVDGVVINIAKTGRRRRRIESSVVIDAGIEIVWGILTDYEKLAHFIPGLAVSRLLHKAHNYARLFQIGQQNIALGFKFNAKAVLDCYEKELEILSFGQRRDIEFKMVEGDFDIFEGKWSIQQYDAKNYDSEVTNLLEGKEQGTILSYVVEVKPKPWLPVGLIEDRLCKEIKTNLCCVREEAHLRLSSSYL